MKNNSIKKTLPRLTWTMIIFLLVLILPANVFMQLNMSHKNQQDSSEEIFAQLEQVIEQNQKDLDRGKEDFSEKAIQSAEMAAYFVEYSPEVVNSIEQSKELAEKLNVDEIHFFTPDGEVYGGSHPQYYGYTFNSGEQMSFFLPMLEDKSLKLCQEITPNTAEGKEMQYAAVWMENGSGIVQIGMEPRRLLQEIEEKSLTKLISSLPLDMRGYLHIIDKDSNLIVASTSEDLIGTDIGSYTDSADYITNKSGKVYHQEFNGEKYCVYMQSYDHYIMVRTYLSKYPAQEIVISTALVLLYVGTSAAAVIWIIGWYTNRKLVYNLTSIVNGLKKIENGNMENIALKTNISEFDELIDYINQMLNSIRLNWNKLAYIIDKSQFPVGIFERNSFYKKTFINIRLLEILGIRNEEELPTEELVSLVESKLNEARKHKFDDKEHIYGYNKNGINVWIRIEEQSDDQSVTFYVTDVSLWRTQLEQIKEESNLDFLTSLYNRRGFSAKLDNLFTEPEKLGYGMMIMVDADCLKMVNDIYGHHIGDEYLKDLAKLLSNTTGISSVCARLGGDEFAVFLYGYTSSEELEAVFQSLKEKRGGPFAPEDSVEATLEFSMGSAIYPTNGVNYHLLMHIADENMYQEKKQRSRSRRD